MTAPDSAYDDQEPIDWPWLGSPFTSRVYRMTPAELLRAARRPAFPDAESAEWYDWAIGEEKDRRDRFSDYR